MDIITYAVLKKRIKEAHITPEEEQEIINKAVDAAIEAIVGLETPEELDTLKEIADWIKKDETGTAKIISDIEKLQAEKYSFEFVNILPNEPEKNVIYVIKNDNDVYVEYIYNEHLNALIPLGKDFTDIITDLQDMLESDYAKKEDVPIPSTDEDIDKLFE